MRKVCGVGINDTKGSSRERLYHLWCSILYRCYSKDGKLKNPSYDGCYVSEEWLTYSKFREDVTKLVGYSEEGWQLDKDILVKGNKVYSKDTCCFVPSQINSLFAIRKSYRGELPIGVCIEHKSKKRPYSAQCSVDGKYVVIGYYQTIDEAFYAYKSFKELNIKRCAKMYVDRIDKRVYDSLMSWSIEITD